LVRGDVLALVELDPDGSAPLYQQIFQSLQHLILTGRLPPGSRLPSIRTLARGLDVSRNTVVNALDQLAVEGYLTARVGAGTFVSRTLPEAQLQVESDAGTTRRSAPHSGKLSKRGLAISRLLDHPPDRQSVTSAVGAFSIDGPELSAFPWETWRRLSGRVSRRIQPGLMGYQRDLGYERLREVLAEQLALARGVRCTPDQIIVVSGSQEALFLAANALLDPGDEAWVEDPGYPGTRRALTAAGASMVHVPVDGEGMRVEWARDGHPQARLACVTPSHQFPMGPMLSLPRRLQLLDWAHAVGAWILEDDYDSEYRYRGRPLEALHGLDGGQRVVYAGTMSKVLFPGLRLGYIVAPSKLVRAFAAARTAVDLHPPLLTQAILAEFVERGHYWRHVRRMRTLYGSRCAELVKALRDELGDSVRIGPHDAGMHLVIELTSGEDDRAVARRAAELGIECLPVSGFAHGSAGLSGLVLGYGRLSAEHIGPAVRRLAQAISETSKVG
jgi:GntR family transcriptional regulator/MocR family aminotransferase